MAAANMDNTFRFLKCCVTWCFFLLPYAAFCQTQHYRLDGEVTVENGDTYQYQLDFDEHNGVIHGYSLTWLDPNLPSKARLEGHVDKQKRAITISEKEEKNMLLIQPMDICYFNGTLVYKYQDGGAEFSCKYTGLNKYQQYCGHGLITLFQNAALDSLFTIPPKPQPKAAPRHPADHTTANAPAAQQEVEVITAGNTKELDWKTDTCIIDIWDYGYVDGDIITVFFNGKNMLNKYEINATKKQLRLPLGAGENVIRILAENEGKAPPNTARLLLTDGKKQYSFTAYNTVGKSAEILLRKKR